MKVLVADDDPVTRRMLDNLLSSHGYNVYLAESGDSAFELYKKGEFTMALVDWMMPPLGGLRLCQEIRDNDMETGGYTYIIMITAKKEKEDEIRAFEAGVDNFISKPLDKDVLLARMKAGQRMLRERKVLLDKIQRFEADLLK